MSSGLRITMFKPSKRQYSRGQFRAHPYRLPSGAAKIRHPIPQLRSRQYYRNPSPIPPPRTSKYYRRTQRFVSGANSTPLGPETRWRPSSGRNSGIPVTRLHDERPQIWAEDCMKEETRWRGEVEQQLEIQTGLVRMAEQAQVLAETKFKMEANRRIDVERELETQIRLAEETRIRFQSQFEEEKQHRMEVQQAQISAEARFKEESSQRTDLERQLELQNQRVEAAEQYKTVAELRVEKESRARQVAEREMMDYAEMQSAFRAERDVLMRVLTEARIQSMIEAQRCAEIGEQLREQEQLVSHLQARLVHEQGRWNRNTLQRQPADDISMSSIHADNDYPSDMDASMCTPSPFPSPSPPVSVSPPSSPQLGSHQTETQSPHVSDPALNSFTNNSRSPTPDFHSALPSREPSPLIANNSPSHVPSSSVPFREPSLPPATASPAPYTPPALPESKEDWFVLYENRWQDIRQSIPPARSLTFSHFPWPVFRCINSVNELCEEEVWVFFITKYPGALDRKWKEELRRWHTDKLVQMLERIHPSYTAEVEAGFLRCITVITAFNSK